MGKGVSKRRMFGGGTLRNSLAPLMEVANALDEATNSYNHNRKQHHEANQDSNDNLHDYVALIRSRHPDVPNQLYSDLGKCKTKGEAKRMLREYLVRQ